MQRVARIMEANEHAAGVSSAVESAMGTDGEKGRGEPEKTDQGRQTDQEPASECLDDYRYLLLLHCYAEGIAAKAGKLSSWVKYVVKRQGFHGQVHQDLSHLDLIVMSRVMEYHGDSVEKVDLDEGCLGDNGLQLLLPGLLSCTCLQVLRLSTMT